MLLKISYSHWTNITSVNNNSVVIFSGKKDKKYFKTKWTIRNEEKLIGAFDISVSGKWFSSNSTMDAMIILNDVETKLKIKLGTKINVATDEGEYSMYSEVEDRFYIFLNGARIGTLSFSAKIMSFNNWRDYFVYDWILKADDNANIDVLLLLSYSMFISHERFDMWVSE